MTPILIPAAANVLAVTPAAAQERGPARQLGYFLPSTRTIHQLIPRCPTAEEHKPLISTTIAISDRTGADRPPSSGSICAARR
jgi:hypothetical protein